jgi:hypothetical protein
VKKRELGELANTTSLLSVRGTQALAPSVRLLDGRPEKKYGNYLSKNPHCPLDYREKLAKISIRF